MSSKRNPLWAEGLQLVPVISLALPFILDGRVDLARAGSGFLVAALLAVPITAAVLWRRHLLNPILLGTDLWLWLGLIAFKLPAPPLANWFIETQAFGIFVGALAAGALTTFLSSHGYIACYGPNPQVLRRASLMLLGLTVVLTVWAWAFRHNVRLGGGLPFILLNIARRLLIRRVTAA